ncbi:MAG: DUF6894 family protein [Brevundimonas aurantiaca]|uniref:DUF6894 family protein n=1 Tax=Brevundimonas TaxID=41275 RepID=UPI001CD7BC78|nr:MULTISPECIES: hypothetical protein [Brevundimonas]MEC8534261.1 hypothetical protein [Pseudomonadota bacterium]
MGLPRYFFHTQNGDRIRDDQGEDLPNVDAAREEAVTILGEILRYRSAGFWDTGVFSVIVTDAEGVTVVSVTAKASQEAPQGWALADADE